MSRVLPATLCLLMCLATHAGAQTRKYKFPETRSAIGLRFAGDFNRFKQKVDLPLIDGSFSTGVIGLFYKEYYKSGIAEVGVNYVHKSLKGGFNLPLVMQNFNDKENTSLSALEAQLTVGPRFWYFYPRFGFVFGYWLNREGFLSDGAPTDVSVSNYYFSVPVGFSFDLPTSFGTTGVSFYYPFGVTDVMTNSRYQATRGRFNTFSFEIHVAMRVRALDTKKKK